MYTQYCIPVLHHDEEWYAVLYTCRFRMMMKIGMQYCFLSRMRMHEGMQCSMPVSFDEWLYAIYSISVPHKDKLQYALRGLLRIYGIVSRMVWFMMECRIVYLSRLRRWKVSIYHSRMSMGYAGYAVKYTCPAWRWMMGCSWGWPSWGPPGSGWRGSSLSRSTCSGGLKYKIDTR